MKLSLCMILRDEGKTIRRCLDSCSGFVDEYIIGIDKNTKDNTREEVEKFIATIDKPSDVYEYEWHNNFAEARNLGMEKATGDYILIMDGHEFFPSSFYNITENKEVYPQRYMAKIKETFEDKDFDSVFFHLYQQPFTGQVPNNYFMQPRIYRNGDSKLEKYKYKKLRFGRAAHNTMLYSRPELDLHYPEIIIIHDADEDNRKWRKEQRLSMNIKQLKDDLEKNPNDTRAMFYLGNTFLEAKKYDESIKEYTRYFNSIKRESSESYQAYIHRGLANKEAGNKDAWKDDLFSAVKINPHRRDANLLLGDYYADQKDWELAVHFYNVVFTIQPDHSRMFQNGPNNTYLPHQQIAIAYHALGRKEEAIAHLKAAYKYMQHQGWLEQIKEWSGDKRNILIVDAIGTFTKDLEKSLKDDGYNVVKVKEWSSSLAAWADYIWCEWGDRNAAEASGFKEKTVIRVHGYEAYLNQYLFEAIPWDCKQVVFVAEHIKEMMQGMIPSLNGQAKIIHNGVDTNKFYIKNKDRGPSTIGYAGYMNVKKNPMRLASIIKKNSHIKFHLRVDWQDAFLKEAFMYETKGCENIVYHGRYEDLNDFWNQVSGVISTSDIESFSYNVAEAMAAGCQPYIYNWKGASNIWNDEWIFDDTSSPDFSPEVDEKYRQYIIDNYPLDRSLADMKKALVG